MAKCRNCGTDIPEGAEYCEECLSKLNTAKDSESYLDSLLSAMMTEEPERREIVYPKKEASSLVSMPEDKKEDPVKPDLEPFYEEEPALEPFYEEEPEPEDVLEEAPPMEEAFGTFFDGEIDLPDLKNYSIFEDVDESAVDRMLAEDLESEESWDDAPVEESSGADVGDIADLFGMLEDERGADAPPQIEVNENPEVISAVDFDAATDMFSGIVETPEEEPVQEFGDIGDLFGDFAESEPAEEPVQEFGDFADLFGDFAESEPAEEPVTEFGDFADLFGEPAESEPMEEPVTEFGDFADLFGEPAESESTETVPQDEAIPEFGDFTDLLDGAGETETSAAAAEEPVEEPVNDFFDLFGSEDSGMFDFGAEPVELDETGEPAEDSVPLPVVTPAVSEPETSNTKEKKPKKQKKPGRVSALYHKLFDNVKIDPSKIKKQPTKEELEAQKKAKQEEKERTKEEKEALLAEKKEQDKQVKLEKQRIKKEAKAEKKARKLEEAKLLLEEMESTRINRAGASIVFIFFAMIAVVIIVGTSIFSYSLSIRNAEYEFNRDEYTLAYNEIYGLEVKDEDILLYDRIMTVMYVQKQLNSYYNYYGLNDQPKALDSLLKGLQRYEKYIELAVDLEVDSDLDSVRKKILTEINTTFTLTEQEAMEIIQSDSQAEYSKKVYDAVDKLN